MKKIGRVISWLIALLGVFVLIYGFQFDYGQTRDNFYLLGGFLIILGGVLRALLGKS
ncbi:hypothetical protein ACVRYP_03995 [Streptococcus rifensis]